ncbi:MAG: T9SS type A sorting domain-containing protein [Candidatus Eisenbacteria bacterium]
MRIRSLSLVLFFGVGITLSAALLPSGLRERLEHTSRAFLESRGQGRFDQEREEEREKAGAVPNDWFLSQRAFPNRDIDPAARSLALEQARAMTPPIAGGSAWTQAGPTNVGGRITAVASVPGGATVFVGSADAGVFRSLDSGATWTPVMDATGIASIGAIALDPSSPSTVYVGTGEANASGDSFAGEGLFRSTDNGDSWESLGLTGTRHIGRVVVDPSDPARIYVAAAGALFSKNQERGIYRSTDGGLNWERTLFLSDSTAAIDVAIDPATPSRLYAATWERIRHPQSRRVGGLTSGVYRSTNGGTNWTRLNNGLPAAAANVGRIGIAIAPSNPLVVYALYADDPGNFLGLYRSSNAGDSWTRVNDGALASMYNGYGWYFGQVRVNAFDANRVYALGLDVWRSTNGGSSWAVLSSGVHVDMHDLWIDPTSPGRLILGSDGGVYSTLSGGSPWVHAPGLAISQFYAGALDPQHPERLYGGLQDNGTVRTLTGALDDWENIYGGDGFYCLVDPRNSNVIFAEAQYGALGKSTNNGGFFNDATSGISGADRRNWSTPVVFDPGNPDRLYYGTYRVYRSTNGAASWSAISPDLTGGPGGATLAYATITTLAVAPSDGQRLWAGTDDARVWSSSNGGGSWQNRSVGLPNLWVTRLAVDPVDAQIAYVAHSGYTSDLSAPHLHRTTNFGLSWTAIDTGLPDAPVNALAIDPDAPSTIFAGTDVGVFVSHDRGESWSTLASGLPIGVVHDLILHRASRTLVAATHGRSMYKIALGAPAAVAIGDASAEPRLDAPAPNPAARGDRVVLRYDAPGSAPITLGLYDAAGRRRLAAMAVAGRSGVWSLAPSERASLPAGVYFARLTVGSRSISRRVVLVD